MVPALALLMVLGCDELENIQLRYNLAGMVFAEHTPYESYVKDINRLIAMHRSNEPELWEKRRAGWDGEIRRKLLVDEYLALRKGEIDWLLRCYTNAELAWILTNRRCGEEPTQAKIQLFGNNKQWIAEHVKDRVKKVIVASYR